MHYGCDDPQIEINSMETAVAAFSWSDLKNTAQLVEKVTLSVEARATLTVSMHCKQLARLLWSSRTRI